MVNFSLDHLNINFDYSISNMIVVDSLMINKVKILLLRRTSELQFDSLLVNTKLCLVLATIAAVVNSCTQSLSDDKGDC